MAFATVCAAQRQETLIAEIFDGDGDLTVNVTGGDVAGTEALDVNYDGRINAADILLLAPGAAPTPTRTPVVPTGTATQRATPTATPTREPTSTPTRTQTLTATPTATAVRTPTPTITQTPTPNGLLFAGMIADLVPHQVGNTLTYRVSETGEKPFEETDKLMSIEADGTFAVEIREPGNVEIQKLRDTGNQLFFVSEEDPSERVRTTCDPVLLVETPIFVGATFTSSGVCRIRTFDGRFLGQFERANTLTPLGLVDEFTVPAGTFTNVIHLSGTQVLQSHTEEQDVYFAAGVGVIFREVRFGVKIETLEFLGGVIGGLPIGE